MPIFRNDQLIDASALDFLNLVAEEFLEGSIYVDHSVSFIQQGDGVG